MISPDLQQRQWKALLQKLRSFPLDWRNDEVNARRLDALGKEAFAPRGIAGRSCDIYWYICWLWARYLISIYIYIYLSIYGYKYTYTYIYIYKYIYIYIQISIHIYIYRYLYIYVYITVIFIKLYLYIKGYWDHGMVIMPFGIQVASVLGSIGMA